MELVYVEFKTVCGEEITTNLANLAAYKSDGVYNFSVAGGVFLRRVSEKTYNNYVKLLIGLHKPEYEVQIHDLSYGE